MISSQTFEQLVLEGDSVPLAGWDFEWFEGRATEERPSWGYARMMSERMATASAALDVQTGGGEVLATVRQAPAVLVATESWPPNVAVATRNLRRRGGHVVQAADRSGLPFRDEVFDLVVSRHPTVVRWEEIGRVLRPGGTYFSQQVGAGSNRELTTFMMGSQPVNETRRADWAAAQAEAAGLSVVDLRQEALRVVFTDIGAVVHFLRKVLWTVPGFTTEKYHERLAALHALMQREGPFVCHAQRFLIEARKGG
jgi:SAM-dependent methyltransferase